MLKNTIPKVCSYEAFNDDDISLTKSLRPSTVSKKLI